jgi:hypothetical protein
MLAKLTLLVLAATLINGTAVADGPVARPDVIRCATAELRQVIGEEEWSSPGAPRGTLPCDHTPVGPPPNPQVGSTWDWYLWRLAGFPVADLKSCTIRGMGDNCYVVVEDDTWNVTIDQAQVDTIVDHFENMSIGSFPTQGIWDLNTTHFGDPPDNLDQDPRVYLLYYDLDVSSDGFFWIFDQQCDDVAQFHSNECDVVYINSSVFDPAGSYLLAVLGHEFEHLIHHNYDPNEDSWVDEGMGELAMWLYGDPDNISAFNTNPDRQLTTFDGSWRDYIKTYLWSLYFYERYGGQPSVKALVAEPANSIAGYENVLDAFLYTEDFADVFGDWVAANYLDDTSIGDGRFGYVGETLPPFSPFVTITTYPVGPSSAAVQHWAADYARYLNGSDLLTTFDGSDNNSFRVRALLLDPVSSTEVVDMSLDGTQAGQLFLPQIGSTHEELVMVYASAQTTGGMSYQYGAETGATATPVAAESRSLSVVAMGTASGQPSFAIAIPEELAHRPVRLELFDVTGRLTRQLMNTAAVPGSHRVEWDGRDGTGRIAAAGVYFVRLSAGAEYVTTRVALTR